MFRNKSLVFKFILFFSGASALIFLFMIWLNYRFSENIIMENIRENAENLTLRTVNRIESALLPVKKIPENMAYFLESGGMDKGRVVDLLAAVVKNNDELYGAGIAFEPYAFDAKELYFGPYYAKDKNGLSLTFMGQDGYRYFNEDWYQIPRELGRPVWSEPYFDDIIMATYSVPFFSVSAGGKKSVKGVICADISLENLTAIVSSVKILKTGDAFLISKRGTIITHPVKDLIMNETIFSVAASRNDKVLRRIARGMIRGESGFVPFVSIARGEKCWLSYAPVPSTGWTLGIVLPEKEFLEDIREHTLISVGLGSAGILVIVLVITVITRSVTRSIRLMSEAAGIIGSGNLDA